MRFAHLELADFDDLDDLFTLLRAGATVGVTARAGHLFGPVNPTSFAVSETPTYPVADLRGFLAAYLRDARGLKAVSVPPGPETGHMEAAWRALNHAAGLPLPRLTILHLAAVVAAACGGRIELQHAYGDAGWLDFVRDGLGWLVLWHKPSLDELQEIADHGARGVILGEVAERRFPWFHGMAGPYPLPNLGVVDHDPADTPATALLASGGPSGLGERWDHVRQFLPLCGLLRPSEATEATLRTDGWAVSCAARDRGHIRRPALHITRAHPTVPRAGAGAWISAEWDGVYRVDFTD